ncbi:MAG: endonuclease domain-containing protein [Chloroflexi bacterium]|nr:endonuclease domain-containing protein [Chloroflexota bacterium]
MTTFDDAVYRAQAAKVMTMVARELRQRQTPAEENLWQHLRNRRLDNLKFRRQTPIENTAYVVDFLCYEARLVVELDGGIHANQVEADAIRQEIIEAQGYTVLRFTNEQLANDLESVLTMIIISAKRKSSPYLPSP